MHQLPHSSHSAHWAKGAVGVVTCNYRSVVQSKGSRHHGCNLGGRQLQRWASMTCPFIILCYRRDPYWKPNSVPKMHLFLGPFPTRRFFESDRTVTLAVGQSHEFLTHCTASCRTTVQVASGTFKPHDQKRVDICKIPPRTCVRKAGAMSRRLEFV